MEVLFKDRGNWIYYIRGGILGCDKSGRYPGVNLTNIPHLDDVEVLYHYRCKDTAKILSAYYEYNGRAIVRFGSKNYGIIIDDDIYTKDYTLVNLRLLEDGDII